MIDANKVPAYLRERGRWCVYKRTSKGRKRPYHATTLRADGWDQKPVDFATASAALSRTFTDVEGRTGKAGGLGLLMGDGVAGMDLDSCIYIDEAGNVRLRAWAMLIVEAAREAGCWIERSISGTGLHIVGLGAPGEPATKKIEILPAPGEPAPKAGEHTQQVDLFTSGYFTVSGRPAKDGLPADLGSIDRPWQVAVDLIARTRGDPSPGLAERDDDDPAPMVRDRPKREKVGAPGGGVRFSSPMDLINDLAVQRIDEWFGEAFPGAHREAGGAWKIEAADLGREGSDRVSAKAGAGINDHWSKRDPDERRDGSRSPIDMLIDEAYEVTRAEAWTCATARDAAIRLAQQLDLPPWIVSAFRRDAAASGEVVNVFAEQSQPLRSPPWPRDVLPGDLLTLAAHRARRLKAPPHLLNYTHLVGLVAAVPGGVTLDLFGDGSYVRSTAVYAAILGASGSAKSPAWKMAIGPLTEAEAEWAEDYRRQKIDHDKRERRAAKRVRGEKPADLGRETDPTLAKPPTDDDTAPSPFTDHRPAPMVRDDEPRRRRRTIHDATSEALVSLMAEHDAGLILIADELTGLLGSLDKYSGRSARGGSADSATYLSMYDGAPVGRDRIKAESAYAARSNLTIVTGAQPAFIAPLVENLATDGFLQRIIWCVAPGLDAERDLSPIDPRLMELHRVAFRLLLDLRMDREPERRLGASPEALALWSEFDRWCSIDGLAAARSEPERNLLSKAPDLVVRLALGLHLLWWSWERADLLLDDLADPGGEPRAIVGPEAVRRAVVLVRDFLIPSGRRVYELGETDNRLDDAKRLARALRNKVRRGTNSPVTSRTMQHAVKRFRGRKNAERLHEAVDMLIERNLLTALGGGAWSINPALYDLDDPGGNSDDDD